MRRQIPWMLSSLMFVTIAIASARAAVLPQAPVAPVPAAPTQAPVAPVALPAGSTPIVPIVSSIPVVAPIAAPMVAQGQQPPPTSTPTPQSRPTTRPPAAPPMRPATPPAPQGQTPRPSRAVPTQNVRVEVTITDTFGNGGKKIVSMLIADNSSGQIRSSNEIGTPNGFRPISINIDASPSVLDSSRIHLGLNVQYQPDTSMMSGTSSPKPATINESITLLVTDGKPTVISQSADPATDRRVTVEVTATVVK
jgi:hypothetical protein